MNAEQTTITFGQPEVLVAALAIGILACTRMVRLIVDDDYPPVLWMRRQVAKALPPAWLELIDCPWCVAPYVVLVDMLWAVLGDLHWTWWFGNVWAGASWVVSYLCMRDVPADQRE